MRAYFYDIDTGTYLSNGTLAAGYDLPANATDVAPPSVTTEQVAIWSGGQWIITDRYSNPTILARLAEAVEQRDWEALASEQAEVVLPRVKKAIQAEINAKYATELRALVASYPDRETNTFDKQENEARAWMADSTAATPFIDGMLMTRSITKTDLTNRIVAKADSFADAAGQLTGKRQSLEEKVVAATTLEELEDIQW